MNENQKQPLLSQVEANEKGTPERGYAYVSTMQNWNQAMLRVMTEQNTGEQDVKLGNVTKDVVVLYILNKLSFRGREMVESLSPVDLRVQALFVELGSNPPHDNEEE
ncbi:MAG: hypothetical protein Q7R81_05295 [Candidatus Peregrinibacteria bacterium]|nr:hypothetical protein [Candidatus Peregrinibacteria bacterium]